MSSPEHIIDELVRDLEILQYWHSKRGMVKGVAKHPQGHIWYKAPYDAVVCWCPQDEDHTESPLVLYERKCYDKKKEKS